MTSKRFTYTIPRTGYLQIPALAMVPDGKTTATNATEEWTTDSSAGALLGQGCFSSAVSLPNRAKITSVSVAHRNAALFALSRTQHATGATNFIVSQTLPSGSVRTVTTVNLPSPEKVSTAVSSYLLTICLDSGQFFYGARIKYTYRSAGD